MIRGRRIVTGGTLLALLILCSTSVSCFCQTKVATYTSSDIFGYIEEAESNPVIPCGSSLDWDQHIREIGNILHEPDDTGYEYKTFYSGYKGRSFTEAFGYEEDKVYIGYAFSSDRKSWTKYGQIISHPTCLKIRNDSVKQLGDENVAAEVTEQVLRKQPQQENGGAQPDIDHNRESRRGGNRHSREDKDRPEQHYTCVKHLEVH